MYHFLLLFINWSFKRQEKNCRRKLWDSQNHFVSLYFKSFFAFKFLTCIIRSWLLSLLKEYAKEYADWRKVPTGFLNVMRGRKVKSRSAHRTQLKPRRMLPSWCKECFMLRGKSLARHPWPAVMDLPSEVHVHSHGRSCTEIAAEWGRWHGYSRRLHLFARWVKKLEARLKVDHFLTQNAWSKSCEQKVALLALDTKWFLRFGPKNWSKSSTFNLKKKFNPSIQSGLRAFLIFKNYWNCDTEHWHITAKWAKILSYFTKFFQIVTKINRRPSDWEFIGQCHRSQSQSIGLTW